MVYRAYATQTTQAKPGPTNLLSHTNPVGVEFFSYDNAADHVSENALLQARKLFLNDQWRAVSKFAEKKNRWMKTKTSWEIGVRKKKKATSLKIPRVKQDHRLQLLLLLFYRPVENLAFTANRPGTMLWSIRANDLFQFCADAVHTVSRKVFCVSTRSYPI